jgi:hypothetical protein
VAAVVRARVLAAVVLVALTLSTARVAAETLTPTPNPLPGSSFQGGDGDQADAAPHVDWASLQAAGGVTHAPDDNAQDTAFSGGVEANPDEWTLGTQAGGVMPEQSNILDVWASVDEAGGMTFLYLAFARAKGTGTGFQTFELNRDRRLWRNSEGALIPCRLDGDVLIAFEPHGNDATTDVELRRWHTTSTDPASGCARSGTVGEPVALTAHVDAQGAANPVAIPNSLPGILGGTIPERQFGEVALNAQRVGACRGDVVGDVVAVGVGDRERLAGVEGTALVEVGVDAEALKAGLPALAHAVGVEIEPLRAGRAAAAQVDRLRRDEVP